MTMIQECDGDGDVQPGFRMSKSRLSFYSISLLEHGVSGPNSLNLQRKDENISWTTHLDAT